MREKQGNDNRVRRQVVGGEKKGNRSYPQPTIHNCLAECQCSVLGVTTGIEIRERWKHGTGIDLSDQTGRSITAQFLQNTSLAALASC